MPSSPHGCTASAEWSSRRGCCQLQNSSSAFAPPLSAPTTLTSLSPTLTSLSPRMLPENALGTLARRVTVRECTYALGLAQGQTRRLGRRFRSIKRGNLRRDGSVLLRE